MAGSARRKTSEKGDMQDTDRDGPWGLRRLLGGGSASACLLSAGVVSWLISRKADCFITLCAGDHTARDPLNSKRGKSSKHRGSLNNTTTLPVLRNNIWRPSMLVIRMSHWLRNIYMPTVISNDRS